jgi:hypothetical protein
MAMMAITTSNSINVNAERCAGCDERMLNLLGDDVRTEVIKE